MRSLIDITIGMSCSTIRIDEPSSCWIALINGPNVSVSFCATPAVGSSRRISRASSASSDASSTMRRVPVDSSLSRLSPYRPSPR